MGVGAEALQHVGMALGKLVGEPCEHGHMQLIVGGGGGGVEEAPAGIVVDVLAVVGAIEHGRGEAG